MSPYVVDRIDPPRDNPFKALFFISGLDFFANGEAAICTAHGDVWIVRGLDESLEHVTWQRYATGLYQPLGLEIVDEKVIVLGRDQLTRLHDENGDGEADFYESFNHDLIDEGMPHAYAMRLERTPDGSFVFVKSGDGPHGSALLRLSADGERLEVVARGFRHPFGMGAGPQRRNHRGRQRGKLGAVVKDRSDSTERLLWISGSCEIARRKPHRR